MEQALDACGLDRTVPRELADQRLAAVVREARSGDQQAARLALQRVFAGLIRRAAARSRSHQLPLDKLLDELMSAAWLVITQFPLERRPSKIAVNIIKDAENALFGYVRKGPRRTFPMDPIELRNHGSLVRPPADDPEDREGTVPLLLLNAIGKHFTRTEARLLAQLIVFEVPIADVAQEAGTSTRWVRKRKERALKRLAAVVAEAAQPVAERECVSPEPVPGGGPDE